ncbi:MAG: hypothetical protein ACFFDH_20015 [Promethearchaeota archaeon]
MKRLNSIKIIFLLVLFSIFFSYFLTVGYSNGVGIPNRLQLTHYLSSNVMPTHSSKITFTRPSSDVIHVVWYLGDPIDDTASWDVNTSTRIVSNGQSFALWDGEHSFFWIYTNVSLNDQIVLSNIWKHINTLNGDAIYNITGEAMHGTMEVWVLEDDYGSELWYEKERGFLVNGTSKYSTDYHTYEYVSAVVPTPFVPGYNYLIIFSVVTIVSIVIVKERKFKK